MLLPEFPAATSKVRHHRLSFSRHIYRDQASLLVQVGLLDPATLPAVGAEAASWLIDRSAPLNRLLGA